MGLQRYAELRSDSVIGYEPRISDGDGECGERRQPAALQLGVEECRDAVAGGEEHLKSAARAEGRGDGGENEISQHQIELVSSSQLRKECRLGRAQLLKQHLAESYIHARRKHKRL